MTKVAPQPPNTTEESSQNSDVADTKSISDVAETKSLSPPTSVPEPEGVELKMESPVKMEIDNEIKLDQKLPQNNVHEISQEELVSYYYYYSLRTTFY